MIVLSQDPEALAQRLAATQGVSVEDAIRQALEARARATGIAHDALRPRQRMSRDAMLAFGAQIAAMPALDTRTPHEIMADINAL
jgi:antitoxin VapB